MLGFVNCVSMAFSDSTAAGSFWALGLAASRVELMFVCGLLLGLVAGLKMVVAMSCLLLLLVCSLLAYLLVG